MRNNKGQALIEFILVLPVLLLLMISIVDFGNIILKKYSLENEMDTINQMYISGNTDDIYTYLNDKNITIEYKKDEKFTTIELSRSVKINSPALILVFGNNYEITTEKSIYSNE